MFIVYMLCSGGVDVRQVSFFEKFEKFSKIFCCYYCVQFIFNLVIFIQNIYNSVLNVCIAKYPVLIVVKCVKITIDMLLWYHEDHELSKQENKKIMCNVYFMCYVNITKEKE